MKKSRPAVFLDRDGVIFANERPDGTINYNQDPDKLTFEKGALEALRRLHEAGYPLIIITNQGGIEAGYLTEEQLNRVHDRLKETVQEHGGFISEIRYCKHLHTSNCPYRKPSPLMILETAEKLSLDLSKSWMIGDMTVDILAGKRAGCKTILLKTGFGGNDNYHDVEPDFVTDNLLEAAELILSGKTV